MEMVKLSLKVAFEFVLALREDSFLPVLLLFMGDAIGFGIRTMNN